MKTRKENYQIIAIVTGLILLSSTIFNSAPIVFADDDDHKNKLKKLKDLIDKWKKKKKCPDKKKYEDKCDNKKPKIAITSPKKKEHVPNEPEIMITGTASDDISGIDKVLVKIDRRPYAKADFERGTGNWEFTTDLNKGWHFVFAKAIDNVGNAKRSFTFFKVV